MRREECERLGLGRSVRKIEKDLRYCNHHPLGLTKGKTTSYVNVEGNKINVKVKDWHGPKGIGL